MYDAAVIGSGLLGLMAAWRLGEAGMSVAVLDRKWVAGESSALAAGHVPQKALTPTNLGLLRRTKALVDDLDRRTGGVVRFHKRGGLQFTRSKKVAFLLKERVEQASRLESHAQLLSPGEVESRWPRINVDGLEAAVYSQDDGFVRPQDLTVCLAAMCRLAGVQIYEGCAVQRIAISDSKVQGVIVGDKLIKAHRVLLAAGGWSSGIAGNSGFAVPLQPFVLELLMLLNVPFTLPFIDDADEGYYLINRHNGPLVLGLPPVTEKIDPQHFSRTPNPERVSKFLDMLFHRVPDLKDAIVGGGWAGLLVDTPDGLPLVGEYGDIEGLHLATGLAGGGAQRVTIGEVAAELILGQEPTLDISKYRASRFNGYRGEEFAFKRDGPFYYDE